MKNNNNDSECQWLAVRCIESGRLIGDDKHGNTFWIDIRVHIYLVILFHLHRLANKYVMTETRVAQYLLFKRLNNIDHNYSNNLALRLIYVQIFIIIMFHEWLNSLFIDIKKSAM